MTLSLNAPDRGYVLDHGRIALSGPQELADDPGVVRANLGEDTGVGAISS